MTRGLGQRQDPPVMFQGLDWAFPLHLYQPHDPYHPTPFDPNRDTEINVTGWDGKIELTRNLAGTTTPTVIPVVLDYPTQGRLHYGINGATTAAIPVAQYTYVAWLHDTTGTYLGVPGWFVVLHGDLPVRPGP